jgi:hypothetical protein
MGKNNCASTGFSKGTNLHLPEQKGESVLAATLRCTY